MRRYLTTVHHICSSLATTSADKPIAATGESIGRSTADIEASHCDLLSVLEEVTPRIRQTKALYPIATK
jgi:hypothetical protein